MNQKTFSNMKNKNQKTRILINEKIRSAEVRVIFNDNTSKVLPLSKAISIAKETSEDLILVSPNATPPVCKIMQLGKYQYELSKNKTQTVVKDKEIRLSPVIAENDFNTKINHAIQFLNKGMHVKIVMEMKGRLSAYPDKGMSLMHDIVSKLEQYGKCDSVPKVQNNRIQLHFSPKKH